MNIVFIMLVIIGAIALWFLLSFAFFPLGKIIYRIWKGAVDGMNNFGDKRTQINAELDIYLKEKFAPYGIIIDTVNFTDISVDDETAAAIQKKVTAQQELELANIEAQTAQVQAEKDKQVALIDAEKNKETAQIQAEQEKIKAEGEAAARGIAAQAEAEANRKIAESLTAELIEKIKVEQWNGEMPTVQGSGMPIVNID